MFESIKQPFARQLQIKTDLFVSQSSTEVLYHQKSFETYVSDLTRVYDNLFDYVNVAIN